MTTNSMLLNKYMDFLVEKDFRLLLSLDGNEINNSYRITKGQKPSFKHVVKNIKDFQKKYPVFFEKRVSFNSVIHDLNSAEESINFIYENFNKVPMLSELSVTGIKENMRKEFSKTFTDVGQSLRKIDDQDTLREKMDVSYPENNSLIKFLHQYSGNVFKNHNTLFREQKYMRYIPTGTCLPFSKRLFLSVGGTILPCERIGHQFKLGRVVNNNVLLSFEDIANQYNNYFDRLSKFCNRCYITERCLQCIFNIDDLDASPICKSFMTQKLFGKFIANNLRYLETNPMQYQKLMNDVLVQ